MADQWTLRIEPEGEDGRIDLPDEALALLGIAIGDEVEVDARDGMLVVTPVRRA